MVDAQAVTTNHPGSEREPPPGWLSIRCSVLLPVLTAGTVGSCSRSGNGNATRLPFRYGCNAQQTTGVLKNQKASREASERLLSRNGCRYEYLSRKKKSFSLSGIDPDQPPVSHQSIDLSMPVRVWASLWAGVSVRGTMPRYTAASLQKVTVIR